jgi:hypothetical protein
MAVALVALTVLAAALAFLVRAALRRVATRRTRSPERVDLAARLEDLESRLEARDAHVAALDHRLTEVRSRAAPTGAPDAAPARPVVTVTIRVRAGEGEVAARAGRSGAQSSSGGNAPPLAPAARSP